MWIAAKFSKMLSYVLFIFFVQMPLQKLYEVSEHKGENIENRVFTAVRARAMR
jgi:hypothetical protein